MVRFPISIDMSASDIYFSMFDTPYWMSDDRIAQLKSDNRETQDFFNDTNLIKKIAYEDFGVVLEYENGYFNAVAFFSMSLVSSFELADRAGWVYKSFFKNRREKAERYYIVMDNSEITILNDNIFNNSSRKNGIYNIISIFILALARDAGMYPNILQEK